MIFSCVVPQEFLCADIGDDNGSPRLFIPVWLYAEFPEYAFYFIPVSNRLCLIAGR